MATVSAPALSRSASAERSDQSRYRQLVQLLEERLVSSLRHAGWSVDLEATGAMLVEHGPDRASERYVVDVEVAREPRRAILCATLADALLRARAASYDSPKHLPLAVVGAPRITEPLAEAVRAYAARYAPQDAYGIIDAEGRLELHGGAALLAVPPREEHALAAVTNGVLAGTVVG